MGNPPSGPRYGAANLSLASQQPLLAFARLGALSSKDDDELSPPKVGDALPSVEVFEGEPSNKVNVAELFKGKKGVLFGVPGAFTPGCSKTHLPGFVEQADALKSKGAQVVACLSVNDVFVVSEWGLSQKAEGKVRLLADPSGAFGKVLYGGAGRCCEGPECGTRWHRPDLQSRPKPSVPALKPHPGFVALSPEGHPWATTAQLASSPAASLDAPRQASAIKYFSFPSRFSFPLWKRFLSVRGGLGACPQGGYPV
uniref:Peroxiredoxin-5 n=1 Tax=Monodelphis domestica TaxID=13616 RepID=H9H6A1_MONDO